MFYPDGGKLLTIRLIWSGSSGALCETRTNAPGPMSCQVNQSMREYNINFPLKSMLS
jgi:hypothetical protein